MRPPVQARSRAPHQRELEEGDDEDDGAMEAGEEDDDMFLEDGKLKGDGSDPRSAQGLLSMSLDPNASHSA